MTGREKKLGAAVGAVLLLIVGWQTVRRLLVDPAAELDRRIATLADKNRDLKHENRMRNHYAGRLKAVAAGTFGTDPLDVSEASRARLTRLVERSGLRLANLQPISAARVRKSRGDRAVGWSLRAHGKLEHAVDLLFLLKADPYRHRVDNVAITSKLAGGEVSLHLKYTTLVLGKAGGVNSLRTRPADAKVAVALDGEQRRLYDMITARDILRPYVKRRVVSPPPTQPPVPDSPPDPQPVPGGGLRLADLTMWKGRPEIRVKDTRNGNIATHKIGDRLVGGEIVMVDYRRLPSADDPKIFVGSRLILKFGPEYWSVDIGQSLSRKRRLRPADLPDELRINPATAPRPDADAVRLDP